MPNSSGRPRRLHDVLNPPSNWSHGLGGIPSGGAGAGDIVVLDVTPSTLAPLGVSDELATVAQPEMREIHPLGTSKMGARTQCHGRANGMITRSDSAARSPFLSLGASAGTRQWPTLVKAM